MTLEHNLIWSEEQHDNNFLYTAQQAGEGQDLLIIEASRPQTVGLWTSGPNDAETPS